MIIDSILHCVWSRISILLASAFQFVDVGLQRIFTSWFSLWTFFFLGKRIARAKNSRNNLKKQSKFSCIHPCVYVSGVYVCLSTFKDFDKIRIRFNNITTFHFKKITIIIICNSFMKMGNLDYLIKRFSSTTSFFFFFLMCGYVCVCSKSYHVKILISINENLHFL